jgi:hypothetical protein
MAFLWERGEQTKLKNFEVRCLLSSSDPPVRHCSDHYFFILSLSLSLPGAWGSLVEEGSPKDRSQLLKQVEVNSGWDRFFASLRKSFSAQHEELTADLVTELGKVRNGVLREYQRLNELRGAEEKDLVKRKRLLYLFVKDLSSGVSGEMLSSKSQRDSQMSRGGGAAKMERVEWSLKVMAGSFVALLDGGMLLYVYLFAMNQTSSRQQAWFISFVMWLGFEIFLSSTALVLVRRCMSGAMCLS